MKKKWNLKIGLILLCGLLLVGCSTSVSVLQEDRDAERSVSATKREENSAFEAGQLNGSLDKASSVSLADIPAFSGTPYVVLNDNEPEFTAEDMVTESYETYSPLDEFGRCGMVVANVGTDLMPTEKRGSISKVKPSGWRSVQYDHVDGRSLYNRCHLIGFQLTAENANERNLITGTRYMNVEGMLPFENMVADYVKETDNHVLYRVTPIFTGNNLVANGVQMEAKSVEDDGDGVCFNVYVYNNQPGVVIDYATGESREEAGESTQKKQKYMLNTSTKKFHRSTCENIENIKKENRKSVTNDREELLRQGYQACKKCNP